jgi:periplasmic divalent cation tolerance protein
MTVDDRYIVVFITAANALEAETIADALVEERLAACVNILPGCRSVYRWEGEMQHDNETLMVVKSAKNCFVDLQTRVVELHSYDVPEIIAVDLTDISDGYLNFLRDSLSPDS